MTRHDRTGERIEPPDPPEPHPDDCDGWLPDDPQGRPVPCPECKPHVAKHRNQLNRVIGGPR